MLGSKNLGQRDVDRQTAPSAVIRDDNGLRRPADGAVRSHGVTALTGARPRQSASRPRASHGSVVPRHLASGNRTLDISQKAGWDSCDLGSAPEQHQNRPKHSLEGRDFLVRFPWQDLAKSTDLDTSAGPS